MFPYTISFAMSIYANGKSLEHSNVETVIVARSCAPLLISAWLVEIRTLYTKRLKTKQSKTRTRTVLLKPF